MNAEALSARDVGSPAVGYAPEFQPDELTSLADKVPAPYEFPNPP